MDLNDTPEQAQYREKVRSWLEEHKSEAPVLEGPDALTEEDEIVAARRVWQRKLAEGGLAGATWPKEFGGQGLGPIEQVIISQEIAQRRRARDPRRHRRRHARADDHRPRHRRAEAALPRADAPRRRGVVPALLRARRGLGPRGHPVARQAGRTAAGSSTGQKVWTTNAQFAAYGLLLARTDAELHKHKGLTMFIVPMDAEGVTVRGLRQITGDAEFNEVFFDDVKLDDDAVVGGVDNGWGTALTTLMFERLTIGFGSEGMGYRPERFAGRDRRRTRSPSRDGEVRQRLGHIATELLAVKFTGYRMLSALQQGQIPGPEAGLSKITTVNAGIAGVRARRRRRRPRRAARGRREPVQLPHVVPAGPEVARAGPRRSCATRSASACSGCRPSRGSTRASRSASCGPRRRRGRRDEPRALRRAGLPARRGAPGAVADEHDRGRARGARRRRAARPVAAPRSRPAGPGCWSARSAAARGSARSTRCSCCRRPAAGWPACRCSATCPRARCSTRPATTAIERGRRRATRARCSWPRSRPATSTTAGRSRREDAWRARRAPIDRRRRHASTAACRGSSTRRAPTCSSSSATDGARRRVVEAGDGVEVEEVVRYDPTRSLGHVTFDGAAGTRARRRRPTTSRAPGTSRRRCIAAESVGAVDDVPGDGGAVREGALHVRPRDRLLPGGQARARRGAAPQGERDARCCTTRAGRTSPGPDEFPLAASAARSAAGEALDYASRANISVHGGIGATWEHDAPLFFRRAQLSRRLLGGTAGSTDRVAGELLRQRRRRRSTPSRRRAAAATSVDA